MQLNQNDFKVIDELIKWSRVFAIHGRAAGLALIVARVAQSSVHQTLLFPTRNFHSISRLFRTHLTL